MQLLKKYGLFFLVLCVVLFFLSYKVGNFGNRERDLQHVADELTSSVASVEQQMSNEYPDSLIIEMIREGSYWQRLPDLISSPYEALLYQNDSLIFWTQNLIIPTQSIQSFEPGFSFQKFRNGYYLMHVKKVTVGSDLYSLLELAPVKYEYVTSNSYLKPHFSELFDVDNYFLISSFKENDFLPVSSGSGNVVFYVGIDPSNYYDKASMPALVMFFAAILLLILFLNQALNNLPQKRFVWLRPLILLVVFLGLSFALSKRTILPNGVINWRLFDPELFASAGLASSLGSLILQLLFLFWVCIYITNKVHVRFRVRTASFANYFIHTLGYFIIFFLAIYTVDVIRALVRDSKIQFVLLNPIQPNYFSLIGVVCIALVFICLFLISLKIISILKRHPLMPLDNGIVMLICTMLAFVYYLAFDTGISGLWIMIWANIFILILPYFNIRETEGLDFGKIFLLLVFMSASGSVLLQVYGDNKEKDVRVSYAKKLISKGDAVTEYLLDELQTEIPSDKFVINYFKSPQVSGKDFKDRMQQLYFQEGFSRYTINYYPFDPNGYLLPVAGEDFGFVTENGMKASMEEITRDELYHSSSPSGTFTYLAEYPISQNDSLLGRLYVELTANSFRSAGVYPELLLEEKDKLPQVSPQYSFAIYHNQHLIEESGNYFYDYHLKWIPDDRREEQYINEGSYSHLLYNSDMDTVIVVSKKNNWFSFFTSYFSFLFVVFFIGTLIVLAFNIINVHPNFESIAGLVRKASLRTLIHGFFMVFILATLLVIAYVAGLFFLKQFNVLSQQTITDKMNRVTESVRIFFNENYPGDRPQQVYGLLKQNIALMADVQDIDINFYDLNGNLVGSSQPSFFEKGLISKKMNPMAFRELSNEGQTVLVKEETVGTLKFYSGYQLVRDMNTGQPLVFIHLPYFNSRVNLNEQVGFFFVALVNILVLATVLAGLFAPTISRQITRKLLVIGEEFKKVRLGSSNERIDWHAKDEIGDLVNEYNNMIQELEKSADKLAKSQREAAWREMARQVAHEIKNPLTPMKLSIQHLQRAYQRNDPNLQDLIIKVSNTLIEQIDHLSQIATEFSNFAKMPRPEIESVNVNDVLQSVYDLHKENEEAAIHMQNYAERSYVAADKKQLLSVFNNLVLNAIQSIADGKEGVVNVITENYDGQVVVSVSDNGVGISEDESKRVFTPNFTTKSSGTGLGLAISKNIVESFGGNISFISEKNIGTTFFVRLPLEENGKRNPEAAGN